MGRKLTHNEYVEIVKKVNSNLEIMSEYINSTSPIKICCKKHNVEWEIKRAGSLITTQKIKNGYGCKICGSEKISKKLKKIRIIFMKQRAKSSQI